jgi:hypothetical protein
LQNMRTKSDSLWLRNVSVTRESLACRWTNCVCWEITPRFQFRFQFQSWCLKSSIDRLWRYDNERDGEKSKIPSAARKAIKSNVEFEWSSSGNEWSTLLSVR